MVFSLYGAFCLCIYYFILAPLLNLPDLDFSQIPVNSFVVGAIGTLVGSYVLMAKRPASKKLTSTSTEDTDKLSTAFNENNSISMTEYSTNAMN